MWEGDVRPFKGPHRKAGLPEGPAPWSQGSGWRGLRPGEPALWPLVRAAVAAPSHSTAILWELLHALFTRKLRPREGQRQAQGHRAGERRRWDSNSGCGALETKFWAWHQIVSAFGGSRNKVVRVQSLGSGGGRGGYQIPRGRGDQDSQPPAPPVQYSHPCPFKQVQQMWRQTRGLSKGKKNVSIPLALSPRLKAFSWGGHFSGSCSLP